jgi:transposase
MDHIQGADRDQLTLFPEALDDYIAQDNPVRFVDAFVDSLDLQGLGFTHALPAETGRPPYHPGMLLKLYVYGYLNRIRSSRLLEKEAGRNLELVWLLGKLAPDFKTIADFRKDNRKAIRQVCRAFILLCRDQGLFGGELVAIDGSKFKASNNRSRNITQRQLKRQLKDLDQKIDTYLHDLDERDEAEPDAPKLTAQELREKIDALKAHRGQLLDLSQEMEDAGQTQISLTDPDSRSMPSGGGQVTDVSYNVQVAVDAKHKLIVDHDVTNEPTDRNLLHPMALRAQEALGVEHFDVVADMGYANGQQVKACLDAGITPYLPQANTSANSALGLFGKQDFHYDPAHDCYLCPAGEVLTFHFETQEAGRYYRVYSTSACGTCPLKPRCTRNRRNRRITRWVDEAILEDMAERVRALPEKVKLRKCLVEHPFGTIKRHWNQGFFLTRGLSKVKAEIALTVLAYDIQRVVKILGVPRMIEALG